MVPSRAIALAALILLGTSVARAEPTAPGARPPTMQEKLLLREQWVRAREHERSEVRLGVPLTFLLIGVALMGTSSWLVARGGDDRKLGLGTGIVVAMPVTALSVAVLCKRVKKRRAIRREIWDHAGLELPRFGWTF